MAKAKSKAKHDDLPVMLHETDHCYEDEMVDETLREPIDPSWDNKYDRTPEQMTAMRQGFIQFHNTYVNFAMIVSRLGVWQFCEVKRCRRLRRCAGNNKRVTTGWQKGLYPIHPPCFFGFRDVLHDFFQEIHPQMKERLATIGEE